MESGRGGGGARQRGAERRGFWISLRGKDRGTMVQEGFDFAQDSDEGGGSDYLFISDSEDEISDEGSFLPETEEQPPSMDQPLNAVEEQLVQDIEGQGGDAWKDLGSHAQQLEEEADADEDLSHRVRCRGVEVPTVVPRARPPSRQLQVGLIDKRCRL